MKKVKYKPVRRRLQGGTPYGIARIVEWNSGPAFCMAPHGVLIHRVRTASTVMWDGKRRNDCATYLCGNCVNRPLFFEVPPDGRLVCEKCEFAAKKQGLQSTDSIAGKHVHKGVMIPIKTCCTEKN